MTRLEKKRHAALMRWLRIALVVFLACAVALFFIIVPYRALLPADRISARREGELRIHFLSVGQGDATVVEFPDGDALLIDGGNGSFSANDALVRYLKGLQFSALTLILTHADSDHFGGLTEVLRVFDAQKVYLPAIGSSADGYDRFLSAVEKEGCETDTLSRYDVISRPSGAYAVCISPRSVGETDENDASVTLFLSYEGVNVLLCSDMGMQRENLLLSELALSEDIFDSAAYSVRLPETDILKVAHHGSGEASGEAWLAMLSPEAAIISCGAGNDYRHPAQETLERLEGVGAEIFRTDELGHIVVSISGGGYTINGGAL